MNLSVESFITRVPYQWISGRASFGNAFSYTVLVPCKSIVVYLSMPSRLQGLGEVRVRKSETIPFDSSFFAETSIHHFNLELRSLVC